MNNTMGSSIACFRSNWTNEQLEEAMDVVERKVTSVRKAISCIGTYNIHHCLTI